MPKVEHPMNPSERTADFYLIRIPGGLTATVIGRVEPDPSNPAFVFLCRPDGARLIRIEAQHVTKSSQVETARRIQEDARHRQAVRGN